jgi:tungstate transport system permease protein
LEPILKALSLLFGNDAELRQIIAVTLEMSFFSTLLSSLIGIPLGVLLGGNEFRAKSWLMRITNTLMGLPPVVGGLLVYLVLSRSGPLGSLKLLYTLPAMVIAQVLLITPIVAGMTAAIVSVRAPQISETVAGMGISRWHRLGYMIYECRVQFMAVVLAAFGRSIAEVGAVQIVGGNIQFKTRVMTTAIMMQTNLGQFEFAVALGVVLLLISFLVNTIVQRFQEWKE